MHDSDLDWVTAESTHFRIHYHDDEGQLAEKSLTIAESVYQRLTPVFDWLPKEKTEIVLSDETDLSNGFAMPIPSNRMTLYVSQPRQVSSLEDHNGWLETLILHEFVHILHLDKASGSAESMRDVFGRFVLLFPNMFMPPWMHEGLATYYETDKQAGIGRGQSSYFEMMMRMEVASGIKPLRQINQPVVSWPLGTSRYLYGVYFYQFIADTYGEQTLQKLVRYYSSNLIPFRINDLYESVLGKDLTVLWSEYSQYLEQKFKPQLAQLKSEGLVEGKYLTQTGDFKRSVLQTQNGEILFVSDHLQTGSALKQIQNDGEVKVLAELHSGATVDWHETSGLLIAQPERCNNANVYDDLYRMDMQSGSQKRLTHCQRYVAATWSADGNNIVAVKNYRGQHALHLLDADGVFEQVLWQGKAGETLNGLDWSADGSSLVSSVWREGTGWNIEEFDMQTKTWIKRTHNSLITTDASYIQQTRDIVFSMDEGGVYNAYRLAADTGLVSRLNHVLGGSFSPFITQDNQLLSINYNGQGFDVARLSKPSSVAVALERDAKVASEQSEKKPVVMSETQDYSPWDTLKPTSWFPSFAMTNEGIELGASTFGTDVLNRHSYNLFAGYQSVSQSPVYTLDYIYDRWFPLLKLHAQSLEDTHFDNQDNLIALVKNQRIDAEVVLPFITEDEKWSAHLGYNFQQSDVSWLHPNYTTNFKRYTDSLVGAALVYDTRESYARAISDTSSGGLWSALVETGSPLDGRYQGTASSLRVREYFDLADEHVLALRMDLGAGSDDTRPYYLGGTRSDAVTTSFVNPTAVVSPFNRRGFALRGYGDGESALSGQNMALVSAEYRFPISRIERGWMAPPVGIHQIYGNIFVDAGRAWDVFDQSKTYRGIGAELGVDLVLFYNLLLRTDIGLAKGLDEQLGTNQFYFRLGSSF
ncbi:MAG: hypothetical protein R8M46_07290 [Ghiorsea sp.]